MTTEPAAPLDGFPQAAFDWNRIRGQRVLVLGIGGGCDIVTAHALSTLVPREPGCKVFLGNTKGNRRFQTGLIRESDHVFRLPPPGTRVEAQETGWQFGTAKIDLAVPRGDDGITYMFQAPKKSDEAEQLVMEIRRLGLDFIVAVDTGGDVLKPVGDKPGRDQRMWRIVQRTGIPALLAVVAPGVDGETPWEEMRALLQARARDDTVLGVVSLAPLMPVFVRMQGSYGKNRTPNLILRAWRDELPGHRPGWVTIPRHARPEYPREWLCFAVMCRG